VLEVKGEMLQELLLDETRKSSPEPMKASQKAEGDIWLTELKYWKSTSSSLVRIEEAAGRP
jgi:hypothetical protein